MKANKMKVFAIAVIAIAFLALILIVIDKLSGDNLK